MDIDPILDQSIVLFSKGITFSYLVVGCRSEYKLFTLDMINKKLIHFGIKNKDVFKTREDFDNHFNNIPNHGELVQLGIGLIGALISEKQMSILYIKRLTKPPLIEGKISDIYKIESAEECVCPFDGSAGQHLFKNYPISNHHIFYPNMRDETGINIECWNKKLMDIFGESNVCIPIYQGTYHHYECTDVKAGALLIKTNENEWKYYIVFKKENNNDPNIISFSRKIGNYNECCVYVLQKEEKEMTRDKHNVLLIENQTNARNQIGNVLDYIQGEPEIVSCRETIDVDITILLIISTKFNDYDYSSYVKDSIEKEFVEYFVKMSSEFVSRMDIGIRAEKMIKLMEFLKEKSPEKWISRETYIDVNDWKRIKNFYQNASQFKSDKFFMPYQYLYDSHMTWDFHSDYNFNVNRKPILIRLPFELNLKGFHLLVPPSINSSVTMTLSIGNNENSMYDIFRETPIGIPDCESWVSYDLDNIDPCDGRVSSGIFVRIKFDATQNQLLFKGLMIEVSECTNRTFTALKSGKGMIDNYEFDQNSFSNIVNFARDCLRNDCGIQEQIAYLTQKIGLNPASFILKDVIKEYLKNNKNGCQRCGRSNYRCFSLDPPYLSLRLCDEGKIHLCRDCLKNEFHFVDPPTTEITQTKVQKVNDKIILYSYPETCNGDQNSLFTQNGGEFSVPEGDNNFEVVLHEPKIVTRLNILSNSELDREIFHINGMNESVNKIMYGSNGVTVDFKKNTKISAINFSIKSQTRIIIHQISIDSRPLEDSYNGGITIMNYSPMKGTKRLETNKTIVKDIADLRRTTGFEVSTDFNAQILFSAAVYDSNDNYKKYMSSVVPVCCSKKMKFFFPGTNEEITREERIGRLKFFVLGDSSKGMAIKEITSVSH